MNSTGEQCKNNESNEQNQNNMQNENIGVVNKNHDFQNEINGGINDKEALKRTSAYNAYFHEVQGCIRERRPDLKFGKIAKVVGICWKKKLEKDPEMKKRYYEKAREMAKEEKAQTEEHGAKHHFCTECKYRFTRAADLNRHLRDHETSNKCDLCDKTFKSKSSLNRHNQTTHSEKQHICDICGKAFGTPYRLREHSLTHQPKQHKCDACGSTFSKKSNLTRHMNSSH